jgi:hypothetical protein
MEAPSLSLVVWTDETNAFVIRVVRRRNFGILESKRYFLEAAPNEFVEVTEQCSFIETLRI